MTPPVASAEKLAEGMGPIGRSIADGKIGELWEAVKYPMLAAVGLVAVAVIASGESKEK